VRVGRKADCCRHKGQSQSHYSNSSFYHTRIPPEMLLGVNTNCGVGRTIGTRQWATGSLRRLLQLDGDHMSLCRSNVLSRVGDGIAPAGFSSFYRALFTFPIRKTHFDLRIGERINDAARMRMHRLLFAWLKTKFEHAHLVVVEQHFVILRR
jgi:hypothetical protein